jgi:hypothetical protein
MTGTNFSDWYNATEGAFVAWSLPNTASVYGASAATAFLNASNYMGFSTGAANTGRLVVRESGTFFAAITKNPMPTASLWKQSFAYKTNDTAFAVNGALVGTDNTVTLPIPTYLSLGTDGTGVPFSSHLQKLMYYPQRLTNAEVTAFSK